MAYILYKNVTPWVLASYLNSLIVTQLQEMTDPENDQSISVNTALTLMVGAINCLTFMYQAKKSAETTINMLILMAKASNQFSQAGEELQGSTFKVFSNPTPEGELKQVTICEQENCNFLRKFKGGIENSVNYWAIRGLLWGISFIPYVGKPLSAVLLILYDGQFILAMAMPDHCNRHITAYLEQNWELAASLGLGSRAINFAFVEGVFYLTGIPREHYQDVLQKFAILMQIGTATHMSLPAPVKKSSRELLDPLSIFSRGVDFVFELMTAGAKKKYLKC